MEANEKALELLRNKKKKWLALLTLAILFVVVTFLWVVNHGQPDEMQGLLNIALAILGVFAAGALLFFIFLGDFFDEDGRMQSGQIILVLTTVISIIQITLAFATYSLKQLDFENASLQKAKSAFAEIGSVGLDNYFDSRNIALPEELKAVHLINHLNQKERSTDTEHQGQTINVDPLKSYRFPYDDKTVVMDISESYQSKMVTKILLDLLTALVASIILTIELIVFMVKFIEDRLSRATHLVNDRPNLMVGYVRHIAFLFYFSSRMATTFIALFAKDLGGSIFGLQGNVLAGLPQSAEFLLTCAAIFATSMLIEKRGWKVPFVGGVVVVTVGTFMSAFATDIVFFIVSRAVVGLGYGFCWMTLRNFALFATTEHDRAVCFSMLNVGIYAGINSGSVIGAVLADIIGYAPVLIIAGILTLACTLTVVGFENTVYVNTNTDQNVTEPVDLTGEDRRNNCSSKNDRYALLEVVWFVFLMILPSCILGSYLGYYLPIYFSGIGKVASDIGRAQLVYGLIIAFVGPYLVRTLYRHPKPLAWNMAYNLVISTALIVFGYVGGFVPGMLVVIVLGFADSFGFVMQNNYFLNLTYVKRMGESRALSYVSLVKKVAEMLGPIAFGLTFIMGSHEGVAMLGAAFLVAAIAYAILSQSNIRRCVQA